MDIQIAMTIIENNYEDTKILIPASSFNPKSDSRLLIPFSSFDKIGFMNKQGEVIVEPRYTMYYGECYSSKDLIKVSINESYGFIKNNDEVDSRIRTLYGLINYKGEIVLDTIYRKLELSTECEDLVIVQNKDCKYGVIDLNGNVIVPFGKYSYIYRFDKGFARVKLEKYGQRGLIRKYGLIDEQGKEVLPVEYDDIWKSEGKFYDSIRVLRDGIRTDIPFSKLQTESNDSYIPDSEWDEPCYKDDYGTHYGEYAGCYAQDVMGYSDDVIGDAFDGEPDAYWNID